AAPPLLRPRVDAPRGLRARRVRDAALARERREGDGGRLPRGGAPPPRRGRAARGDGRGGLGLPRRDGDAGDGVHAPGVLVLRRPQRPARAAAPAGLDHLRPGLLRPRRPRRPPAVSGAPEAGAALTAEGVTHRYGAHVALREVTFSVAPGERFALLGPNGGGKTTLFRLAATLMRPSEGRVTVFGHDTAGAPAAVRRRLGVIFQQPALDRELTVRESLRAHAALVGVPRAEVGARAAGGRGPLGQDGHAGPRRQALPGGLARRTDLARGLLHRPALLLLDEPTTGLDPAARRDLWDALDALLRRDGTTQVVATHLMDEAERCDRVGILDRGRLVALEI